MRLIRTDMRYIGAISDKLRELDEGAKTAQIQDIPGITPYLTTDCPECGENPIDNNYPHLTASPDQTSHGYLRRDSDIVLIGCEGYHILDPALLGMDREGWDDWTDYIGEGDESP